ncbi:hypothetical protein BDN70DRAFT_875592 [Pholiota conissans]|uniref:Uncharacterized protein n=1 Tax=Pholiota conissans TaxID=109636 RepID=A0A9P5Z6G0_9AGAR|nr:hypothetical protein BDN70DRAFT_875592 [Pholiota conissans]
MPRMNGLLRILKHAKPARSGKPTAVADYASALNPALISQSSSQEFEIVFAPTEITHKNSLKTRVKTAIGIKKSIVSEEAQTSSTHVARLSVALEGLALDVAPKKKKSAFSKVKRALRKVSDIAHSRRTHSEPEAPLGVDAPAVLATAPCLGVIVTTHTKSDFFNHEDILAIINPAVEETTVTPRYTSLLPRDEPFPFAPRRRRYRPALKRVTTPVGGPISILSPAPVKDDIVTSITPTVDAVPVNKSADEALSTVERLQSQITGDDAQVTKVTPPVLVESPVFIGGSCGSSSSLSASDDSGVEPISSATGSPVSPTTLNSDTDDDPFTQLKRVYVARKQVLNKIISIKLEHAGRHRSELAISATTSGFCISTSPDQVAATGQDTLEASEEATRGNGLELCSVVAQAPCEPVSRSTATHLAAPRVSHSVSSVNLAALPVMGDLESSFPSLLETTISLASVDSMSSLDEARDFPSMRAAWALRHAPRRGEEKVVCEKKYTAGTPSPTPLDYYPPPSPPGLIDDLRSLLEALYANINSPTPRRTMSSGPLVSGAVATSFSLASTKIPRRSRPRFVSLADSEDTSPEAGPRPRRNPLGGVATSTPRLPAAARQVTLPHPLAASSPRLSKHVASTHRHSMSVLPMHISNVDSRPSMIPRRVSHRQEGVWYS